MAYKVEVIINNIPENDIKIIAGIHLITGKSLIKIKELIINGLPIYSEELSFTEYFNDYLDKFITFLYNKNVDAIIDLTIDGQNKKRFSLIEFMLERIESKIISNLSSIYSNEYIEYIPIKFPYVDTIYFKQVLLHYKNGDFEKALEDCNLSIEINDNESKYYIFRTILKRINNDYKDALNNCNKALELNKDFLNYNLELYKTVLENLIAIYEK